MKLFSADMTKALICSMNSITGPYSFIQKLYGDPDDYAYKLGNSSFANDLPIHMSWIWFRTYDFIHSLSIDAEEQKVYYSNNAHERLEYGRFVYDQDTSTYFFGAVPETNQVTSSEHYSHFSQHAVVMDCKNVGKNYIVSFWGHMTSSIT